VIHEDSAVATITKEGAAEFSSIRRGSTLTAFSGAQRHAAEPLQDIVSLIIEPPDRLKRRLDGLTVALAGAAFLYRVMRGAGIEPGKERAGRRRHHGNFVVVAGKRHDRLKGVKPQRRVFLLLLRLCIEKVGPRDCDGYPW
jgi:hypothetical protein